MSAFISIACTEGAYLLTDGAVWRYDDPRLVEVRRKVWTAQSAPVAITSKGNADEGRAAAIAICRLADELGVETFYNEIQGVADGFKRSWGTLAGQDGVHIHVSLCLPGSGGAHLGFKSFPAGLKHDRTPIEPYHVTVYQSPLFHSGSGLTQSELIENDLYYKGGSAEEYAKRAGLELMEIMRHRAVQDAGSGTWMIGGRCDFTAITAAGCRTETLRTWPDVVGERIDPFRVAKAA